METPTQAAQRTRRWMAVGLLGTAALGAALRWTLAGVDPLGLGARFAAVRHAHSHLGYYLFLFPALWAAWRAMGRPTPGRWIVHGYGAVALAGAVAFALGGYGGVSIAASTAVGAAWGLSTWRARWPLRGDWRAAALPAVAVSLALVVPIALLTRRSPAVATHLVRSFLTLLLLGGMLPAWVGAARVPAWLWGAGAALAAFGGGFAWAPGRAVGYGVLAAALLWATAQAPAARLTRALWRAVAVGFAAYAVGWPSAGHGMSLAGVHFIALGPVVVQAFGVRPGLRPSWALWPYLAAVAGLCAALVAGDAGGGGFAARWAAVAGVCVAGLLAVIVWHGERATHAPEA